MGDESKPRVPKAFYRVSAKALILNDVRDAFIISEEEDGRYDLPGGGIDWGETAQECIRREIQEEMGLEVTFVSEEPLFHIFSITGEGFDCINFVYEARVKDLNITPSEECVSVSYLNQQNRSEFRLFSNVEKILDRFTLMKF